MDIVDAQVHANMLGTEVTLAIMDALGVQGVLFDEYQRTDGDGAAQPGYRLADGTFRPIGPNAESAALRHPERCAFLMQIRRPVPSDQLRWIAVGQVSAERSFTKAVGGWLSHNEHY
jgi:hypothetical protein